jgi:DNA modification methylase
MSDYSKFLAKKKQFNVVAGFEVGDIDYGLFDFQQAIVKWACKRGRAGIFADTGLGKTAMQLAWADQVMRETGGRVLILAPLCVAQQTVAEGSRIGVDVEYARKGDDAKGMIVITNYEMMDHFNPADFVGVVLDESSILKSLTGKIRTSLIENFQKTPYRLSCTATPSPNDFMELGNQAEFLGVMTRTEMLATYFIHDGGDTSKWRLKGHGKTKFWEWMATWAICISSPADIGFDGSRYILTGLEIHQHAVEAQFIPDGQLFPVVAQTLSDRRSAKRSSLNDRIKLAADIVNSSDEYFIIWCHLNDESSELKKLIPHAEEVYGSLDFDEKEARINRFSSGKSRVIITKPSITGFGLNWQHCHNMIFVGMDDSYESYYQAVRRCYRFGQKNKVNVHIISSESEGEVKKNIERKAAQADEMSRQMVAHMRKFTTMEIKGISIEKSDYSRDLKSGDGFDLHLGDCVEVTQEMEDESIDYTVFSPPFASLYTYSNSDRDMGNSRNHSEFYAHFEYLISELFRVTRSGRLLSFHCMNLPATIQNDGFIGIKDFRGELIRLFVDAGFIFHSEVVIWKDPVTAMQRTKAIGLLYKQLKKDSCISRQGIPDYLVTMRKPGDNPSPVTKHPDEFPVGLWQRYASPVWMDINPSNTLQFRSARESDDERHICPLQLEVIERAIDLWTNPGDLVYSPFAGIGSEGYVSIQKGRRFVGAELKRSYWELACRNLASAKSSQGSLLELAV